MRYDDLVVDTSFKETLMILYLLLGIVLGAVFHQFWHDLYFKLLVKARTWLDGH